MKMKMRARRLALAIAAASRVPAGAGSGDDEARFRADMRLIDSEEALTAFVERFGVARSTVRGWQSGRFAPHPALRSRCRAWLQARAHQATRPVEASV